MDITIFGNGHLAQALKKNFALGGNKIDFITHEDNLPVSDLVILAVPYDAVDDIISRYQNQLAGKVVVDATNPIDFQSWQLKTSTSSATELASKLPNSTVLKAFNTTTAVSIANGKLASGVAPQVLVAGDDAEAKRVLINSLSSSPLIVIDVGTLSRAHQMEELGLLELSMAANKQLPMDGGVMIIR